MCVFIETDSYFRQFDIEYYHLVIAYDGAADRAGKKTNCVRYVVSLLYLMS